MGAPGVEPSGPDRNVWPAGSSIGRYVVYDAIASGGMASIHLGRMIGSAGFARTVAVKRLHRQYAQDPEFVAMFLDEARLAARIVHPNVVSTLDVVAVEHEIFLVMDYVAGESLAGLLAASRRQGARLAPPIVSGILTGVLYGLHAAHEARTESGEPLHVVHRDVSPQNVIVGVDGVARVLDFGVAKAAWRSQVTREGQLKGKLPYMAPEQLRHDEVDRRTDVYAASVVLWEALTTRRLFARDSPAGLVHDIAAGAVAEPSTVVAGLSRALDAVVMRGLARQPADRFPTALDMARALEQAVAPASPAEIADHVRAFAGDSIARRARHVADIESNPAGSSSASKSDRAGRAEAATAIISRNDRGEPELTLLDASARTDAGYASDPAASPRTRRRGVVAVAACASALVIAASAVAFVHRGAEAPARSDPDPPASSSIYTGPSVPVAEPANAPPAESGGARPGSATVPAQAPPAAIAPRTWIAGRPARVSPVSAIPSASGSLSPGELRGITTRK